MRIDVVSLLLHLHSCYISSVIQWAAPYVAEERINPFLVTPTLVDCGGKGQKDEALLLQKNRILPLKRNLVVLLTIICSLEPQVQCAHRCQQALKHSCPQR